MRSLSVRVLGEFDVTSVEPYALGSRKSRVLLRLLALGRGRVVPMDALTEGLWPQAAPPRPSEQLGVLVSRLRRVLGADRLERRDEGYRLHYDWLDADELESLVVEIGRRRADGNLDGAVAAAHLVLSLLRSDVVIDHEPGTWAAAELVALDRLVVRSRHVACAALLQGGQWLEAADTATSLLGRDPYDEEALRLLMRGHAAGGRPGSALAAYADCQQRLAEDLGADPTPETRDLHAAILRGELVPRRASPRQFPELVGRTVELERLDGPTLTPAPRELRISVVTGEAGIGKTSLLQAWGRSRAGAGDVVILGSCGALDRAAPLDAVMIALAGHLRKQPPDRSAAALGPDAALLGPLLGLAPGPAATPALPDGVLGPVALFAALRGAFERLARQLSGQHAGVVLVLDDAHHAGPALADWLRYLRRRPVPLHVVAGVRSGEGEPLPADDVLELGPLDRAAASRLVGPDRLDEIFDRSGGSPLFLTQLAAAEPGQGLPATLVEAVSACCDGLGQAADTLRSAAVIGPQIDLDLVAGVLHRPAISVLVDIEAAVRRGLVTDQDGDFWFRHALVREALAATATAGRSALLHREASQVLVRRAGSDPVQVAHHARLGGDNRLASNQLRAAAVRAAERFDHATAESLLDDALRLHAEDEGWLQRARVRTMRGRYDATYEDVQRVSGGAAALEVGAWASYFDRRFDAARAYAQDGARQAGDPALRARCLAVGGRTAHAAGDLAAAEEMLTAAMTLASGTDLVMVSAWLGVVRAHQGRPDEALDLLRPATRPQLGVELTSSTLHALLFTGHALARSGRPAAALDTFARYTAEVDHRQVPRFAGRGVNFAGWVLRNLGAIDEGLAQHRAALEIGAGSGTPEVRTAALQDLAEERLLAGDHDAAAAYLMESVADQHGDQVFGWRLAMRGQLLRARWALLTGEPARCLTAAEKLAAWATAITVPRYAVDARLLAARAKCRLGESVDAAALAADLELARQVAGLEAWWWTGELGADLHFAPWVERAGDMAAALAAESGALSATLLDYAAGRIEQWHAQLS